MHWGASVVLEVKMDGTQLLFEFVGTMDSTKVVEMLRWNTLLVKFTG